MSEHKDEFKDTNNKQDIIAHAQELKTKEDFQNYIEEIFPGWLQYVATEYSPDYSYLNDNWKKICEMNNVEPQKIVLVKSIQFDDDHKILQSFCELMTRRGYVVRRTSEFTLCGKCHRILPVIEVWHLMKEKGLPVPRRYSQFCRGCL